MAELLLEIGFEEMPAPWLPGPRRAAAGALPGGGRRASSSRRRTPRVALHAAPPRAAGRRAGAPGRPRGAGLGPGAQGREGRGGEVDGRRAGLREEERRSRSRTCGEGAKDPAKPGELNLLLRAGRSPGRADGRGRCRACSPRVLRALAFPKRMSWDAWLEDGRGAFPFGRPIRWLVAAARRGGRAVRDPRARGRGEGPGRRRERRRDARPPLPAEGRGRASRSSVRSFAELKRRLRERVRDPRRRRSARPGSTGQLRAAASGGALRRPRPARGVARPRRVPDRRGRARCPRSSARCRPRCSRRSSSTTRSTISLRDGGGPHRALRRRHERRRRGRGRDRARDGARGRGAPARRRVLPGRGPEARRSPSGSTTWPASPSTRASAPTATSRRGWRRWSRPWDARASSTGTRSRRRRRRRGSPRPTSSR